MAKGNSSNNDRSNAKNPLHDGRRDQGHFGKNPNNDGKTVERPNTVQEKPVFKTPKEK